MAFIVDFSDVVTEGQSQQEKYTHDLIDLVPHSWFSTEARRPGGIFWAIMSGKSLLLTFIRDLVGIAKRQLRIKTATGTTLDAIAMDYFGTGDVRLPRGLNEFDDAYRNRILAEIFRIRATVQAIREAVAQLVGATPEIFEPFNARTVSCWTDVFNGAVTPYTFAAFGSTSLDQFLLIGGSAGGASPNPGVGSFGDTEQIYTFYVNVLSNPNGISKVEIEALVDRMKAVGTRGIVQGGL